MSFDIQSHMDEDTYSIDFRFVSFENMTMTGSIYQVVRLEYEWKDNKKALRDTFGPNEYGRICSRNKEDTKKSIEDVKDRLFMEMIREIRVEEDLATWDEIKDE